MNYKEKDQIKKNREEYIRKDVDDYINEMGSCILKENRELLKVFVESYLNYREYFFCSKEKVAQIIRDKKKEFYLDGHEPTQEEIAEVMSFILKGEILELAIDEYVDEMVLLNL